jgi:CRP-like cAMP-binding protein
MRAGVTGATPLARAADAPSALDPLIGALSRLAPLSPDDRAAVASLPHEVRTLHKGAELVRHGRVESDCFVLLSAFAHKEKFAGRITRVVAINLPGELVNIESALEMESDYSASVFRAGEAAVIPAAALRELLFSSSSVARAFWLRSQAESALYREWLLNDERRGLQARLAHLICETALRLQLLNEAARSHPILPLDAAEMARAAGSVPLYVNRALAALQEAGAVSILPDGIRVQDESKLAEIGGFDAGYLAGTHGR